MNSMFFSKSKLLLVLSFSTFLFCLNFPSSFGIDWYSTCNKRFSCGEITDLGFPFWGDLRTQSCGLLELELYCKHSTAMIDIMGVAHNIVKIDQKAQILTLFRPEFVEHDFFDGICITEFGNTTFDSKVFEYGPGSGEVIILFNCSKPINSRSMRPCKYMDGGNYLVRPGISVSGAESCSRSVTLGVAHVEKLNLNYSSDYPSDDDLVYMGGLFDLKYKADVASCERCERSRGVCGYSNHTACFCPNQTYWLTRPTCPDSALPPIVPVRTGMSLKRNWAIGIAMSVSGITIIFILIICYRKKIFLAKSMDFFKKDRKDEFDVEAFIRSNGSFSPKRYSYSNVKKMTNSFAKKIGKGGYGAVFKGKLPDGRLVAVKVLSNSKGNGEEFINEVASIGRTSHINVVTLLGFCYERNKRALIYEYMPNGSLDKFIFNKRSLDKNCCLERKTLYKISIGIARGLEYLHRGCNTRILHFDIKPHNILLDKNFCPKISDFGLAKICETDESTVSMLGARGTAGYIAPEVFRRNLGGISYKSDVYSYGMMVLEMVGGRKNIDAEVSQTSEIFFPDWLRKHVVEDENLKLHEGLSTEEEEMERKMILVSLWCIQTMPSDRPSMTKVVEMLEGNLQSLPIPPKSLSSTTGLPSHSSSLPSQASMNHTNDQIVS